MDKRIFSNGTHRLLSLSLAIAVIAGFNLAAVPAEAQLLKNFMKKLNEDTNKSNSQDSKKSDSSGNVTSNMADKKKQAPAKNDGKIGEEAVAMIEDIKNAPNAKVEAFDTVVKNQLINLGRSGKLNLSFSASCRVEIISGGRVTVAADPRTGGSKVSGGRLRVNSKACEQEHTKKLAALAASSSDAGVVVRRADTPYAGSVWDEKTVSSRFPVLVWPRLSSGRVKVTVYELDHSGGPKVHWRIRTGRNHVRYSRKARRLKVGAAYKAEVTYPDGTVRSALFSYDPRYEAMKTAAANAVIIRK